MISLDNLKTVLNAIKCLLNDYPKLTEIVRKTEISTLNGYVESMIDSAIKEYEDTAEYIVHSSTEGSTKKFKITVDDSGTISATEVTE